MKEEYLPLLTPGFHNVDEGEIDKLFVDIFPDSHTRRNISIGLRAVLSILRGTSINYEVWIDGSFTTQKPDPADVNMSIWFDPATIQTLTPKHKTALNELTDTNQTKLRYMCDTYLLPNDDEALRSYWRGWFGFSRKEEPKGVARLLIQGGEL